MISKLTRERHTARKPLGRRACDHARIVGSTWLDCSRPKGLAASLRLSPNRAARAVVIALGVLAATLLAGPPARALAARHVSMSAHTTAFPPIWTKHPRFVRAGARVLFAFDPGSADRCRLSLHGPRHGQGLSWDIKGSRRLAALTIRTRHAATPGRWSLQAACAQPTGGVLTGKVRMTVRGAARHGRLLARRADIHLQRGFRIAGACPSVELLGVRGSGEHSGFGHTIGALVSSFYQRRIPDAQADAIDYWAVDVRPWEPDYNHHYISSVTQGVNDLYARIVIFERRCAGVPLLLAGYSQGAEVVDDALQGPVSSRQRGGIAATALFGDPRFSPINRKPLDQGDYDDRYGGISRLQFIPPAGTFGTLMSYSVSDSSSIRSYCANHDPVCNLSSLGLAVSCKLSSSCAHYHYPDLRFVPSEGGSPVTYTWGAAAFLASRLHAFRRRLHVDPRSTSGLSSKGEPQPTSRVGRR